MVIFYKKWKKYNEIQFTINKMDLNIRKMTNHPPSPVKIHIHDWAYFDYTVTKNMEICDLNSYTHTFISLLFK